jgi:hypothetical protein
VERSICKRAANIGLDIGDFVSDNIHSDNTLQETEEGVKAKAADQGHGTVFSVAK